MIRPLVLLPAVVLAAACGQTAADAPTGSLSRAPMTLDTVRVESLTTSLPVAGTVQPRARAEVGTRMMARVQEIPVDIGSDVRAGDVLIRLGLDDLAAQRAAALQSFDVRPQLPSVTQPVLLVRTEGEGRVAARCHDELQAALPTVQSEWLHTCGQLPHLTHPHRLAKLLKPFFHEKALPVAPDAANAYNRNRQAAGVPAGA